MWQKHFTCNIIVTIKEAVSITIVIYAGTQALLLHVISWFHTGLVVDNICQKLLLC